ncbi:unnamed protein product [Amoebophrya sp. A25]|nr:unnamed protein product [Amoebophrya sp. A25]|eukprot:GSA25T00014643001.1
MSFMITSESEDVSSEDTDSSYTCKNQVELLKETLRWREDPKTCPRACSTENNCYAPLLNPLNEELLRSGDWETDVRRRLMSKHPRGLLEESSEDFKRIHPLEFLEQEAVRWVKDWVDEEDSASSLFTTIRYETLAGEVETVGQILTEDDAFELRERKQRVVKLWSVKKWGYFADLLLAEEEETRRQKAAWIADRWTRHRKKHKELQSARGENKPYLFTPTCSLRPFQALSSPVPSLLPARVVAETIQRKLHVRSELETGREVFTMLPIPEVQSRVPAIRLDGFAKLLGEQDDEEKNESLFVGGPVSAEESLNYILRKHVDKCLHKEMRKYAASIKEAAEEAKADPVLTSPMVLAHARKLLVENTNPEDGNLELLDQFAALNTTKAMKNSFDDDDTSTNSDDSDEDECCNWVLVNPGGSGSGASKGADQGEEGETPLERPSSPKGLGHEHGYPSFKLVFDNRPGIFSILEQLKSCLSVLAASWYAKKC